MVGIKQDLRNQKDFNQTHLGTKSDLDVIKGTIQWTLIELLLLCVLNFLKSSWEDLRETSILRRKSGLKEIQLWERKEKSAVITLVERCSKSHHH